MPILLKNTQAHEHLNVAPIYGIFKTDNEYRIYSLEGKVLIFNYAKLKRDLDIRAVENTFNQVLNTILTNKTQVTIPYSKLLGSFATLVKRLPIGNLHYDSKERIEDTKEEVFLKYDNYYFCKKPDYIVMGSTLIYTCKSGVNRVEIKFPNIPYVKLFLLDFEREYSRNKGRYVVPIDVNKLIKLFEDKHKCKLQSQLNGNVTIPLDAKGKSNHIKSKL